MGDELEDCKVNDRDEGWVDLLDRKSKKRFWVREDAYKYALDPKRNPKPAPLPEPEVESKDDENDLDPSDDETDLTTLLDESPETSDESAVSADQLPVYYAAFDQNPPRMLTTQQIMDGDPFWSNDVPGWKTLSINYTEGYSIKESDYERWMVLTGQKAPEEVKDDAPETTSEFEVTADEFPVFLNKGDATPMRMMTASEMKAAFNVDWIGVDGSEEWIFLEINMSDNYAVRRTDYDKWLELSGG
jgi:hypothetical protein